MRVAVIPGIGAGKDQVQIIVVVEVCPGHVAVLDAPQHDAAVLHQPAAIIPVHDGSGHTVGVPTAQHQVRVSVLVVIPPGHRAVLQRPQALTGADEVLNLEDLFLRFGRHPVGAVHGGYGPVICIARKWDGKLDRLAVAHITRAYWQSGGKHISSPGRGPDAQRIGKCR